MKKISKFLSAFLALMLLLGLTVSAASPDLESTSDTNKQEAAAIVANNSVIAPEGVEVTIKAAKDEQIFNVIEKVINPVVVASLDISVKDVIYVFDIEATKTNAKLSFRVPYVEKDSSYVLLHMNDDGTVKEVLPAVCGADGWITAKFTTYSIYAVIEIDPDK